MLQFVWVMILLPICGLLYLVPFLVVLEYMESVVLAVGVQVVWSYWLGSTKVDKWLSKIIPL